MRNRHLAAALLACCGMCLAALLYSRGQEPDTRTRSLVAPARPAFTIMPLVQELEARPGQRVKFGFEVESQHRESRLNIQIVGLHQDEAGLIHPDEGGAPPGNVQLFGPANLTLRPGQRHRLEGTIVLPLDATSSIGYGILVTDVGQELKGNERSSDNRVQVQFVTRYLLRVHVNLVGTKAIQSADLDVVSAELVEEDGRCLARVRLHNPQQGVCDIAVRCRMVPEFGPALDPPFFLVLPIRRRDDEQARPACKILGKSTVAFEAIVPHPVTTGDYRLEVDTLAGRLPYHRRSFAAQVDQSRFPDHAHAVMQIGGILRVEPPQLALSLKPRGDRLVPLTISNASRRDLEVQLQALGDNGTPLPWALIRPESFSLTPGSKRIVLVGIQQATNVQTNVYGHVSLTATTADGTVAARRPMPLGVLVAGDFEPQYAVSPLSYTPNSLRTALLATVRNEGPIHLEPFGRLKLRGPDGQVTELHARPGSWLLPGETGPLPFPLRDWPAPGDYHLTGEIHLGPDYPPHLIDQRIVVTAPASAPLSEEVR